MAKQKKTVKSKGILSKPLFWVALVLSVALVAGGVFLIIRAATKEDADPGPTLPPLPEVHMDLTDPGEISLDKGLVITDMGSFRGPYYEDGSDAEVSDVMMLVVKNTSDRDLQLARIDMTWEDAKASFEVTNLPAGSSAVILEKNRKPFIDKPYKELQVRDVLLFAQNMSMHQDRFTVTSGDGYIEITNISDKAVAGEIYVYYKYFGEDSMFYGGITYRAAVKNGLQPGQTQRVPTRHMRAAECKLLMVTFAQ